MTRKKKLPVGIENFADLISEDFYFVDKTGFIMELLHGWGEVNIFTRPRRFGKSLNMSMLKTFFETGCDKRLFEGLRIAEETELCKAYMGKFPVISISLKDVDGLTFESACAAMRYVIGKEALRFQFLQESSRLTKKEKELYAQMIETDKNQKMVFGMSDAVLAASLQMLSFLISKHYGQKVIILIDEYDVPLDKAFQSGYYQKMVSLIRNLFSNAVKGNDSLYFAVLTGCLRVSKESIFTGLNHPNILSVTDVRFSEYFGFTDREVREMLSYYGLDSYYGTIREWYDGYQFGNCSIYCPWDVIKYCYVLLADPEAEPEDFWSNTSSNYIVRRFIDKANQTTKEEIERLVAGETIDRTVRQELTYNELDTTIDNLWSVLFMTGYLTSRGRLSGRKYRLAIPNRQIRELFVAQIKVWFQETAVQDPPKLDAFCKAFPAGDASTVERMFNDYLWRMISIRDTFVQKQRKENFYHGILLGLLQYKENWLAKSNEESGEGYSDILVEIPEEGIGVVIEVKYAENDKLDAGCTGALDQIEKKKYESLLKEHGMKQIRKYGIACYRKHCKVAMSGSE